MKLLLFSAALFIRLPFFFRDYIDRDESTFILMGQSVADGFLPYTHLWDLKPPLLFYIFGAIETAFPYSFVAIRFFGVLVVFISALLLLNIAKNNNLRNGHLIALLYILLSSEFGSLQGLMSEHLAVFFMLAGILFFQRTKNLFFLPAGLAFGCALLCKMSFAYAVAMLVVYVSWVNRKWTFRQLSLSCLWLLVGLLLPFFVLSAPFFVRGEMQLFIDSVYLAPLEYAKAQQYSFLKKLAATWWILLASLSIVYLALKRTKFHYEGFAFLTSIVLLGVVYTFVSSGIVNGHYLIQAYPFLLILLLGFVVQKEVRISTKGLVLFVILVSFESLAEYYTLFNSVKQNQSLYYRPGFTAVDELKKRHLGNEKIFFADYHIGYWMLRQYPLTKSTTHPTNLARPFLFKYFGVQRTSLEELQYLFNNIRPDVVVNSGEHLGFFSADGAENAFFRQTLRDRFTLIYKDPQKRIYIWQRI